MNKKDQSRERRLQKKYGITVAEYEQMLKEQDGVCKICKKPPVNYRLSVDHDHRFNKKKVFTQKLFDGRWKAIPDVAYVTAFYGKSKAEAKEKARQYTMSVSVRGLLCSWCNRGLRYYHDNPVFLENAAKYLRGI